MAGDDKNLLWIEHSALPAQHIFDFTVIQARDPARHDQQRFIADPETDRLSDLRGFDTLHLRRKLNSRRAVVSLDKFDVRRVRLKEGADRIQVSLVFRPYSTGICPVAVIEGATHREGAAAALKHSLGRPLRLSLSRLVNCCRASHPFADLVGIDLPGGSYRDRHSHHRLPIGTISAMSASGADGSPRPTNGRYRQPARSR